MQTGDVPLFFHRLFGHELAHQIGKTSFAQAGDLRRQIGSVQNVIALLVNDFALVVRYVIVFQQLLADIEIARLNFALSAFNTARDHTGFNSLALRHIQTVHDGLDAFARKNAHQRIIKTEVKT